MSDTDCAECDKPMASLADAHMRPDGLLVHVGCCTYCPDDPDVFAHTVPADGITAGEAGRSEPCRVCGEPTPADSEHVCPAVHATLDRTLADAFVALCGVVDAIGDEAESWRNLGGNPADLLAVQVEAEEVLTRYRAVMGSVVMLTTPDDPDDGPF